MILERLEALSHGFSGEKPGFREVAILDFNPLSGHKKRRVISVPNQPMKILHRRFVRYLRDLKISMPNATGGVPGQSPIKNVSRHKKVSRTERTFPRYFFLVDLSNAYASVCKDQLASILCGIDENLSGKESQVAHLLDRFFIGRKGGLIIGGPASPDLFNLYCEFVLDQPLRQLCGKHKLEYTRFIDDLTFSAPGITPIGKRKRKALCKVVREAGFKINHAKTKVVDLRKGPTKITGVDITPNGRTSLPKSAARELNDLLHLALNGGDINPSKIHGKMGIFLSLTNIAKATRMERKILERYQAFKRLTKGSKNAKV